MVDHKITLGQMLELIRESFTSPAGAGEFGYVSVMDRATHALARMGLSQREARTPPQPDTPQSRFQGLAYELQALILEAYWYLIRNGYVVEKPDEYSWQQPTSQGYRWTDRGLRWLAGGGGAPEDVTGYLGFLESKVPNLDPTERQYIVESVVAFERQSFFAAAVMLGAASEKALYDLADAALVALRPGKARQAIENLLKRPNLSQLAEQLRKMSAEAATANPPKVPYAVTQGVEAHLASLVEAIRVQRNDAVHPVVGAVNEENVRFALSAFPFVVDAIERFRAWMLANPASL